MTRSTRTPRPSPRGRRRDAWGPRSSTIVAIGIATGALLGWINLNSDDDGIVAILLLLCSAGLAAAQPRRAWAWALFLAACFPASSLLAQALRLPVRYPAASARWQEVVLTLIFASVGALAGWSIRRITAALSEDRR